MSFDVGSLTNSMIDSVRKAIGERWDAIRDVAELELLKLAQTLEDVNQLRAAGKIDMHRAIEIVQIQRNTAETVLTSVEGLGILTGREAIEAAADAAGAIVNRLVGFRLISTKGE
jgi:hypothetical protein